MPEAESAQAREQQAREQQAREQQAREQQALAEGEKHEEYNASLVDEIIKEVELEEKMKDGLRQHGKKAKLVRRTSKRGEQDALNPLDLIEAQEEEAVKLSKESLGEFEKELSLNKIKTENIPNIQYERLDQVSNQMYLSRAAGSAAGNSLGLPKCVAVGGTKYLAFGTSYSLIAVFNCQTQTLFQQLGDKRQSQQLGSVSALDFDAKTEVIVAGYESGELVLWDMLQQKEIKRISGAFQSPVLCVKFWAADRENLVACDAGGSLQLVQVKWNMWNLLKGGGYTEKRRALLERREDNVFYDVRVLATKDAALAAGGGVTLLGVCSLQHVTVLALSPHAAVPDLDQGGANQAQLVVSVVFRFTKPAAVKRGFLPTFSWGSADEQFGAPTRTSVPVAAIGWGALTQVFRVNYESVVRLVRARGDWNEYACLAPLSFYVGAHGVYYQQFLAHSMLAQVNSQKLVQVLQVGQFRAGSYLENVRNDTVAFEEQERRLPVKNSQQVLPGDQDFEFQIYIKDQEGNLKSNSNNALVVLPTRNELYMVAQRHVFKGKLFKWHQSILYLTDKERNRLHEALKLAWELYLSQIHIFAEYPKLAVRQDREEYESIIRSLLMLFMEKQAARLTDRSAARSGGEEEGAVTWRRVIMTAIEFLVGIQNFELLFGECKNFFFKNEHNDEFIACLEYFIMTNQIKAVPNTVIQEVVYHYLQAQKLNVVQNLILNLDVQKLDIEFVEDLCLQNSLFTPLIYLRTRYLHDFNSPLLKMFQAYQQTAEADPERAKKYIYKCMWMLRMTLNGKVYPNDDIDAAQLPDIVRQTVVWIFFDDIHRVLAKVHSAVFFEVLALLFAGRPREILLHYDKDLYHYFIGDESSGDRVVLPEEIKEFRPGMFHTLMIRKINAHLSQHMETYPAVKLAFGDFVLRVATEDDFEFELDQPILVRLLRALLQSDDDKDQPTEKLLERSSNMVKLLRRYQPQVAADHKLLQSLLDKAGQSI